MHTGSSASDSQRPPAPCIPIGAARRARSFKPTRLAPRQLYYTMQECAAVLGWRVERTRRHLMRSGAAVKRGGQWLTTKGLLRRALPQESAEFIAELELNREENR